MITPKISVLMPAYNAEKYIEEAIESVLNQTFGEFELIIIDDASTDDTREIIRRYQMNDKRIILIANERNLRISASLNAGLLLAQGKYIVRMDADDWAYPHRFQAQIAYMEANPNVVVSGGKIEICSSDLSVLNKRVYWQNDDQVRAHLFRYSPFCHASIICKREILSQINGYNTDLSDAEDYDLYFRLGRFGAFGNISSVLLKVRTHGESMSRVKARRQESLTLYIRLKAVLEYGYRMTLGDKGYFFCQLASMYLIPSRMKFWIFNFFRSL